MVLIDTSIWIQLFRQRGTPFGEAIVQLTVYNRAVICGQVLVEFIGGFRNKEKRKEFKTAFLKFPFLETSQSAYELATELLGDFPRLGSGDAIIAATAITHDIPLLALDHDFSELVSRGLQLFPTNGIFPSIQ